MNFEINKDLSHIFSDMANIYQYLGGENRFRALAYGKAAKVINNLPDDVSHYLANNTLMNLPGVGEGIAEKTSEFIRTGKIKQYENLKRIVPLELLSMMEIIGFGPKSLKRIQEELDISTKKDLVHSLQNGAIAKLKGFGPKKVANMLRGLKLHKVLEDRMLLWEAQQTGEKILEKVRLIPGVLNAELAGSLRRKKETIGDIDILVSGSDKNGKKIADLLIRLDFVKEVLAKGDTRVSIRLKKSGRQVDFRIVNSDEWGSALQYFTGSKEHNIHLRMLAKEKGYKISEYGIFDLSNGKKIACTSENEIYQTLGLQVMPPEMREDLGEIELAIKNRIPNLVDLQDIKGDLQMHSTWSDGTNTIEEIARYVMKNFKYEYIVLTDHSKSLRIANGLDEKQIIRQIKEIENVNEMLGKPFVKKGLEVDILSDGTLDISNEILARLDWVTASIHNNLNANNTARIILACENPYVNCIGHPTGRLIGSREPGKIELDKVIDSAGDTGTALEINAQPERMDLCDEHAMKARNKGVPLVISTDSHSFQNFDFMKLGVYIARRAWCTKEDILNTKSWAEIAEFRKKKSITEHK